MCCPCWPPPPPPPPPRDDVALALQVAALGQGTVVGYAGSMGEPNALDGLLAAAALLKREPLRFVLVGSGHLHAHLAARVQTEGLTNVRLLPPIPNAQVPAFLAQMHIAYIGW